MNPGGPGVAPDHHGPQGAEYTLQGVMRFLQMEWHNHERARNAWDIERAEMKAKIAKLEGESRHSKKINEQLERQIRMLEMALKNERAKNRGQGQPDTDGDSDSLLVKTDKTNKDKDIERSGMRPAKPVNRPHNSFLDTNSDEAVEAAEDKDKYRDKSRRYLEKCMQEIQYLLTPPPNPPPPQLGIPNHNHNPQYTALPDPPLSLDELYMRQRQKAQSNTNNMSNHQQLPLPQMQESMPISAAPSLQSPYHPDPKSEHAYLQSLASQPPMQSLPLPPQSHSHSHSQSQLQPPEEPVEHLSHAYDAYGRPVKEEAAESTPVTKADPDGWNFDDQHVLPDPPPADLPQPPRRPDTDLFPSAVNLPAQPSPGRSPASHRRRSSGSSGRRRSSTSQETHDSGTDVLAKPDPSTFKVRFALRGHLDVVRSVIFTGGGSPSEPEICTAGDDGSIKRWIIPASYSNFQNNLATDLDISCFFTHRGHEGVVTSLAACPSTASFATGGRASGDGWIFSGGQDATIRVWERGRVDPKATIDGHTDAVWTVCVLPGTTGSVFGPQSSNFGGPDRILLASGAADGTVKIWAISAPPQLAAPQTAGSRRGVGGSRRHSVTSGSNHPSSPQPNVATSTPLHFTLVHSIERSGAPGANPTCISPLSASGENFVVSYTDSSILIFDTRTGEEIIGMASNETYDGTLNTSINAVVATSSASLGLEGPSSSWQDLAEQEDVGAGPTGSAQGVEGVIISGHEDRYIRFFDANSGQCTYTMLAHPSSISSLSLSKDGREAVSAGHDASIRFWSLDKRICTQDINSHRPMRGEGVCSVVWSQDGRYVVSAGGDGVVKVFSR
ncbi:WD40-repeat-containing domain protein [Delphinella strobiligena]|nr:WD40-repeat-containing domain protein [Delphinella strobiligena]